MFGLTAIEFFIVSVAIFAAVYWITPRKAVWFPFVVLVALFTVLAFNFVPNDSDDVSRYFMQLDYFREFGYEYFERCIEEGFNNWDTYRVIAYYFYYISKLGDNRYLPAITIFIVYGLMMLVIYKAANRFSVDKGNLFLGTLFFISTYWYYDVASGIRNGLAFAVVFACAYYHLVERKRIPLCYVGYVMACLTHSAAVMMVGMVILTEITLNNSGKFMNFMLIFGLIGGGALFQYLASVTDSKFIDTIAGLAEKHQAGDTFERGTAFLVNVSIFLFVSFVVIYVSIYITKGEYSNSLKRLYKYSSIILYFMVGCLYSGLIFVRFARWILPMIGCLFYMIGMQVQQNQIQKDGLKYYTYYSPINISVRTRTRPYFKLFYIAYIAIHFWYLCNGSSLNWIHF